MLSQKNRKDNFRSLVKGCISAEEGEGEGEGGLTLNVVREFSKRAWHYIFAYSCLEPKKAEQ